MANKNKGKASKNKRGNVRRVERRFISQAATNSTLVRAFGALTAMLLGAGVWAYFGATSFAHDEKLAALPSYIIAAGAVLAGITIWIGTSSEPPIRVGSPGISIEKGDVRRMPWWAVEKISFESLALTLVCKGSDESGTPFVVRIPVKANPEAVGYVVKEALERIPRRVEIDEQVLAQLPSAHENAGQKLDLEPLQVVGKKCAATGKMISYEPDARVCARCERVYLQSAVPKKCKCGNSLAHLRPEDANDDASSDDASSDDARTSAKVDSTQEPASS